MCLYKVNNTDHMYVWIRTGVKAYEKQVGDFIDSSYLKS